MYQQGKSHPGSFDNFNFYVHFLGHHKNSVIILKKYISILKCNQNLINNLAENIDGNTIKESELAGTLSISQTIFRIRNR